MTEKFIGLEIKSVSGEGIFAGTLASYAGPESPDLVGDAIQRGAFTKTILDNAGQVPMLWQHNFTEPIGVLHLEDSHAGLKVRGELVMEVARAREAYALLKRRSISGLSIGYRTIKSENGPNGVRILKELALLEGSIVTFPADLRALVTDVKAEEDQRAARELAEFKAWKDALMEKIRW